MSWTLPPSRWWGLEIRPELPEDSLKSYLDARAAFLVGDYERSSKLGLAAIERLEERGDVLDAAWMCRWLVMHDGGPEAGSRGDEITEASVEALVARAHSWEAALILRWRALDWQLHGDWEVARLLYLRSLDLVRRAPGRTVTETKILIGLGAVAIGEGDLKTSEESFLAALRLTEGIAPESLDRAECLADLGEVALQKGDLTAADRWNREALALQERLAPTGLDITATLQTLAGIATERGYLSDAEALFRRSLALVAKNLPGQPSTGQNLQLLAGLALRRGDLAYAEQYLETSLKLYGHDPNERQYNYSEAFVTLAEIAFRRGDLASAHQHLVHALEVRENSAPNASGVADALVSLGRLEVTRGDLGAAREHFERALAIRERQQKRSIHVAAILRELGSIQKGSRSEKQLEEAVSILRDEVPGSLDEAEAQEALGKRFTERGAFDRGLHHFSRAFEIRERIAPGSLEQADALYQIGLIRHRLGREKEATDDFCSAIDRLDRQRKMIGGPTESRAFFESGVVPYYEACLRGLLARGRADQAFAVLERGRARVFLTLLSERDLRPTELPAEMAAERWKLGEDYDRLEAALGRLSPERAAAEVERIRSELSAVRNAQAALADRIRAASPRPASLDHPEVLDLKGTKAILDPGTVLLSYSVGQRDTLLFIVEGADRPGLAVRTLPIGRQKLREKVERFRASMTAPVRPGARSRAEAERLYRELLSPAEPFLRRAARILICPDGPLHALPFAALRHRGAYLVEGKPLHLAPSMSAYAALRNRGESQGEDSRVAIAAFGGPTPRADRGAPSEPELRSAVRRGLRLEPIPFAREEATEAARLFPGGQAFVGDQVTEEAVKQIAPRARILHFACHGLLDEQMPLNSGLALSIPEHPAEGQDNGVLQAWEIIENLRLDADLVTLSACDTALGKDMGGEGILGLTRAFQFAGARSVLSSLWSVEDESTAELMRTFYSRLSEGESKTGALRAAQLRLVRSAEFADPYYWAAFELFGRWK